MMIGWVDGGEVGGSDNNFIKALKVFKRVGQQLDFKDP